jgi:hypothetical protein
MKFKQPASIITNRIQNYENRVRVDLCNNNQINEKWGNISENCISSSLMSSLIKWNHKTCVLSPYSTHLCVAGHLRQASIKSLTS